MYVCVLCDVDGVSVDHHVTQAAHESVPVGNIIYLIVSALNLTLVPSYFESTVIAATALCRPQGWGIDRIFHAEITKWCHHMGFGKVTVSLDSLIKADLRVK